MSGVFVSHAFADKPLVDEFVDVVIRLGCGLSQTQIFYSSGEDTGVPSGYDLLSHVRRQVGNATLVIAIISPSFQSRPVCIAELGAAWSRVENLFPLAVPGIKRADLEGVLEGMAVRYLDDGAALDELHDRVSAAVGKRAKAATWGRYKAKWLTSVGHHATALPTVRPVTAAEVERLAADLEGARAALIETEDECAELRDQLDQLAKTRPSTDVRRIRLPKSETKRFDMLQRNARRALAELPKVAREAIWYDLNRRQMPWPDGFDDRYRRDAVQEAVNDGLLLETGDEQLTPNDDFDLVVAASQAVSELHTFLDEPSDAFETWFRGEYGMPPDLRKRAVWDALLP